MTINTTPGNAPQAQCSADRMGVPHPVEAPSSESAHSQGSAQSFSSHLKHSLSDAERDQLNSALRIAIDNSVGWLRHNQTERGYWAGFLKTNSCIESEWVIAMYFLGIDDDPKYAEVVKTILHEQRQDGSWGVYYGAPNGDINATVESYVALKIAGHPADAPYMQAARQWILSRGGLKKIRVFTRFWLETIAEWEEETGQHPLIALSCTKDVQDSILADPKLRKVVDIIDIRYWHYNEKGLWAPEAGKNIPDGAEIG